jgi:YHS domain-containing protein
VPSSRHVDHEGARHWFCGSGCEDAFRAAPESFSPS